MAVISHVYLRVVHLKILALQVHFRFALRLRYSGVGSRNRDFSIVTSQKLSRAMAYNRYRPHIHRTRIKVQWRIGVVFTVSAYQAKRFLPINISPARCTKGSEEFLESKESRFSRPVILPYGTNSDSSNNYSNNRSYFSLFTAALPPALRQRAIRATKLLTEMRIITSWTLAVLLFFPK